MGWRIGIVCFLRLWDAHCNSDHSTPPSPDQPAYVRSFMVIPRLSM